MDAIVGRRSELDALSAQLARVREGAVRIVFIEGAAGIGKSALIENFLRDHADLATLRCSGEETERTFAYGLLGQVLPTDTSWTNPWVAGAALLRHLGDLQVGRDAVLLVIDDAHWADDASVGALTFALRRAEADRVLCIFGVRDSEAPPLAEGLRRLRDGSMGARIKLGGLDATSVRTLAEVLGRPVPPRRVAEQLCEHTAGNPLHLRALFEELNDDSLRYTSDALPPPRSYAAMILDKVDACPTTTRELLDAGAVLGIRFWLDEAALLLGKATEIAALDSAVAASLIDIERIANRWHVRFTHPLIRAAVYSAIGPAGLATLHGTAAATITDARALHHRLAAAPSEDAALAGELASGALFAANEGRLREAADLLIAASRLRPPGPEREFLICSGVDLLLWGGESGEASAVMAEVEASAPSARRSYVMGHHRLEVGQVMEAERQLLAGWDAHDDSREPDLHAGIAVTLANVSLRRARGPDIVMWARRARESSMAPAPVLNFARGLESVGLVLLGKVDEADAILDDLPDDPTSVRPDLSSLLVGRVLTSTWTDRLARAEADAEATLRLARVIGSPLWMIAAAGYLAEARWRRGEWDGATAAGELSVSLAENTDQSWALSCAYAFASLVLSSRGQWAIAMDRVDRALQWAARGGDEMSLLYSLNAKLHLAARRRDHEVVAQTGAELYALRDRHSFEPGVLTWVRDYMESLVALGRAVEATAVLDEYAELATDRRRTSALSDVARVRAAIATANGDLEEAASELDGAVRLCEQVAARPAVAESQLALGMVLRRQGKRRLAGELLTRAYDSLATLGSVDASLAEQELAACGQRRRRDPSRSLELTPQELTVAGLVARGLSNRDVASELFVSPKTIEYHLGNIYAKLGIRSRSQLAAEFAHPGEN